MLDKWLADLAEGSMEKTASDQFGEALEQLSVEELEAIYDLQGEKIKEAGWLGRGLGGAGGAVAGGLGGAGLGAGIGGTMGALYAPPDRHAEGFWQGARRGSELGGAIGALGGGLTGAGLGGRLASKGDIAAALGGAGAMGVAAPGAATIGGIRAGQGVSPEQPVIVVEKPTKSKSKKGKEKKSFDLSQMEKDAAMGEFLRRHGGKIRERFARFLNQTSEKIDPKIRRRRIAAVGSMGLMGGAVGYAGGRSHERYLANQKAGKTKTGGLLGKLMKRRAAKKLRGAAEKLDPRRRKRIAAIAAGMTGAGALGAAGGYHYAKRGGFKAKKKQAALLKEAAKRGLIRRMVEGVGGIGLGKQRKEVSKLQQHARAAGKTYREAQKGPMRGSPGMRRALVEAAGKHNVARKEYQSRAFGRGVKAIGGVGGAAALGGLGYGGYRLGRRGKER